MLRGEYVSALGGAVEVLRCRLDAEGPRSLATLEALERVGTILRDMGDFELASAVWQLCRVAAADIAGPSDAHVAKAIFSLGAASKGMSSNYDDILPYYQQALSMLDPADPRNVVLIAEITRSEGHYYRYRDKTKSVQKLREALAMFERTLPAPSLQATETRVWLGWTLLNLGEREESRKLLERSREELRTLGLSEHALMGTVEAARADLRALDGDWRVAEAGYGRATQLFEGARRERSTRFAEFPLHAYNLLALARLKQGRPDAAWRSLERYRSPAGVRLLALSDWSRREPASYRAVESARAEVVEKRKLRRFSGAWSSLDQVDWSELLEELSANAALAEMESKYDAPDIAGSVDIADVQAALEPDAAYVGWLDSRVGDDLLCSTSPILDSRWMYIIRSTGPIRWVPLWEFTSTAERNTFRSAAGRHYALLSRAVNWSLRVDDDPEMARLARILAAQEFPAGVPELEGVHRLVVEFFDELTAWRPLECLLGPDGKYLGERFAITYVPSAATFVRCRARGARDAAPAGPVLAVGDPIFSPDGIQDRPTSSNRIDVTHLRAATNGDPAALDALPRLPFAGIELGEIRSAFPGCAVLDGNNASELKLRRLLDTTRPGAYRVIHFATHALAETPLRQRCALALSRGDVDRTPVNDGLVDALEIQLGWKLDADLVTLSGCQTASGPHWFRGEPTGLAVVLLGVGARSVLASMWKVDDLATARLMGRFYEDLSGSHADSREGYAPRQPMPKDVSLAEARNWLRRYVDAQGRHPFAHPAYWSGFVLIGDPD